MAENTQTVCKTQQTPHQRLAPDETRVAYDNGNNNISSSVQGTGLISNGLSEFRDKQCASKGPVGPFFTTSWQLICEPKAGSLKGQFQRRRLAVFTQFSVLRRFSTSLVDLAA
jgi:hypothetical protein